MIIDSLHYWVNVMHVDGFRFDLASILSRDETGKPQANPPVLWEIESDPVLAGTKLIAEAWDAPGFTRWAALSVKAGWNGTADSGMMCADLCGATATPSPM